MNNIYFNHNVFNLLYTYAIIYKDMSDLFEVVCGKGYGIVAFNPFPPIDTF